jgi:AraC family transcriptional regulator, regulatory protein of adaptative response / methylated-DNA-[protein]-cysteine methyltransferase
MRNATAEPLKSSAELWDDTGHRRWQAVQDKSALPGDPFVYAVITTGIFCVPTCGSRRPKKSNVSFFSTPLEAEATGFRPCKRCRPDREQTPPHIDMIAHACRRLETEELEPSLTNLARDAKLSPSHFQKLFKAHIGLSPKQYAKSVRARRLAAALKLGSTVTDAIYEAGYGSASRGYDAMGQTLGMAPASYRQGAIGEAIRYAIARSSLGLIAVAGTAVGISAIEFGETEAALLDRLGEMFPRAELMPADTAYRKWLKTLLSFIETPSVGLNLPLDIQGTAFQRRVWDALREIPAGTIITYTELALRIGQPTAARAVAHACATNRIAVAIPCHRVVRQDGTLAGYRWGLDRKRALLDRERKSIGTK